MNLGYAFDGTFTPLKEFRFVSMKLTGLHESGKVGNRFAESRLGWLPLPFPRQYVLGMDIQAHDFEAFERPSYLSGEWKDGGWWYYYLYGLTIKTPHGTQVILLISVGVVMVARLRAHRGLIRVVWLADGRNLVILLTPATLLIMLASANLRFNHHLRYVLPILGFAFVFAGACGARFRQKNADYGDSTAGLIDSSRSNPMFAVVRGLTLCSITAAIISTLSVYPSELLYFNEVAGGPTNGHNHLLHSSLDDGQELFQLAKSLAARDRDRKTCVYYFEYTCPLELAGIDCCSYSQWIDTTDEVADSQTILILERTVSSLIENAPSRLLTPVQLRLRSLIERSVSRNTCGSAFVEYGFARRHV